MVKCGPISLGLVGLGLVLWIGLLLGLAMVLGLAHFTFCHTSSPHRFNRDLRQHFFTERIINIWNKLDEQTVLAPTLNIFKGNLDRLRRSRTMGLFLNWWSEDLRGKSGSTSEAPSGELSPQHFIHNLQLTAIFHASLSV